MLIDADAHDRPRFPVNPRTDLETAANAVFAAAAARFRRATVADVIAETFDARSFVLRVRGDWRHEAGQHVQVSVEVAGLRMERAFSLSNSPDECPRITLKRNAEGQLATWLFENLTSGAQIDVSEPEGHFVLKNGDADVLFIAAGIGIAPIASMLKQALRAGRPAKLLHVDRKPEDGIFRGEFRSLSNKYSRFAFEPWFTKLRGYPDDALERLISVAKGDIYLCGPAGFMTHCRAIATRVGVPDDRILWESFGAEARSAYKPVNLKFRMADGALMDLQGRQGATLLETLLRQITHPRVCGGRAICGTCRVAFESEGALERLAPKSRAEARLLGVLPNPNMNHRLACQLRLTAEYEGVCIAAAPIK